MRYFDTSFIVPLLVPEPSSAAVSAFFGEMPAGQAAISHWVRVEFAAMLSRQVRLAAISTLQAADWNARFDNLTADCFAVLLPARLDYEMAKSYVGVHHIGLRAPDTLHLAIAKNNRATAFYSLDKRLLEAAQFFGLPVNTDFCLSG